MNENKKPILIIIGFLFLIQILIPLIIYFSNPIKKTTNQPIEKHAQEIQINTTKHIVVDDTIQVYNVETKKIMRLDLESYVVGVVMAEMPASFDIEALKAQAIAARTFAVYRMLKYPDGHPEHIGASVCTSGQHCQEWEGKEKAEDKWGKDKETYYQKIKQAVNSTEGQIMTYNHEPIEVLYYAVSNGRTEEASEVFSTALPYYQSVLSPGEESYSAYYGEVTLSKKEFIQAIEKTFKNTGLTQSNLEKSITVTQYTKGQRVKTIRLGKIEIQGSEFRKIFNLKSTSFSVNFNKNNVFIKTEGYGHGVGMSQVGANVMGSNGNNYVDILQHYYMGISIEKIK